MRRVLAEPVDKVRIAAVKIFAVVFREVRLRSGHAPFKCAAVCFHFPGNDFKQCRNGKFVAARKCNFVFSVHNKADVIKHLNPVNRFVKPSTRSTSFPISRSGVKLT